MKFTKAEIDAIIEASPRTFVRMQPAKSGQC